MVGYGLSGAMPIPILLAQASLCVMKAEVVSKGKPKQVNEEFLVELAGVCRKLQEARKKICWSNLREYDEIRKVSRGHVMFHIRCLHVNGFLDLIENQRPNGMNVYRVTRRKEFLSQYAQLP